jgi:hypothetical protein
MALKIVAMNSAELLAPSMSQRMSWVEIRERHHNEWVCLLEIDHKPDGSIRSARVVGHDRSIERALDQIDPPNPDTTVVHTARHPLWTPRIEIVDESRAGEPVRG